MRISRWPALGAAAAAVSYPAWVGLSWLRYGYHAPVTGDGADALLDRFMPEYDVVDRHAVVVNAPAELTLQIAGDADLRDSRLVRAIFRARAAVLGSREDVPLPRGLLASTKALGWGVLAEVPGREIVMGAVTRPWEADVVFRAIPPEAFASFCEPFYVKIVWTLRVDPIDTNRCVHRTETRVATTDALARSKFRWYWARFSPGIVLIRRVMLALARRAAERRAACRGGER